jgi:hypothetical protein
VQAAAGHAEHAVQHHQRAGPVLRGRQHLPRPGVLGVACVWVCVALFTPSVRPMMFCCRCRCSPSAPHTNKGVNAVVFSGMGCAHR